MYFGTGPSPIEKLLDSASSSDSTTAPAATDAAYPEAGAMVSLEDFLDEDDITAECRSDNKRLLDYLAAEPNLLRLVHFLYHGIGFEPTPTLLAANRHFNHSTDTLRSVGSDADLDPADHDDDQPDAAEIIRQRFKFPHVAAEILSSEVPQISDALVSNDHAMAALLGFLDGAPDGHLDPRAAGHFANVVLALLRCRHSQMVAKFAQLDPKHACPWIDRLVAHIGVGPISDILIRVLDAPDAERDYSSAIAPVSAEAVAMYADRDIMAQLGAKFAASVDAAERESSDARDTDRRERLLAEEMNNLVATIEGITRRVLLMPLQEIEVPPILNLYSVPAMVGTLIDRGHLSSRSSCLALRSALSIATELLTTEANYPPPKVSVEASVMQACILGMSPPGRRNLIATSPTANSGVGVADPNRQPIMSTHRLEATLRKRFTALVKTLAEEPEAIDITTLEGDERAVLGSTRLKLVEFCLACLTKGNDETVQAVVALGVPKTLLELFVKFEWSSILHTTITNAIVASFERGSSSATKAWFEAGLIETCLGAWRKHKEEDQWHRRAYMGHLAQILDAAARLVKRLDPLRADQLISSRSAEEFDAFVLEELEPIFAIQRRDLGGEKPNTGTSKISEDDEFTEVFDMDDVIEGLTADDTNAINKFAQHLFVNSEYADNASSHLGQGDDGLITSLDGDAELGTDDTAPMEESTSTDESPQAHGLNATSHTVAEESEEEEQEQEEEEEEEEGAAGNYHVQAMPATS